MNTRFLSVFSLLILLGLVGGVGYSFWEIWSGEPTATNTSTPVSFTNAPTSTPTTTSIPSLIPTDTPLPGISVPPTFTPTPTSTTSNTPSTVAISSTSTPTPTLIPPPTDTPTPLPIFGIVTATNLNVRWGPSQDYGFVGAVYKDNRVVILALSVDGFWLKIETLDGKIGWVGAKYIQESDDITNLPIEYVAPPPTPSSNPSIPTSNCGTLVLRGASISRVIAPNEVQECIFFEDQKETVFTLMVEPNVIVNKTDHVQFFLYYINAIGQANIVGVGSHPADDLNGDLGNGELVWRGGPLVAGTQYYLRIINNSAQDIKYCLATTDLHHWSCPRN